MKQISQHWAVDGCSQANGLVQSVFAWECLLFISILCQKVFQDVPTCKNLRACIRVVYLPGKFHGLRSLLIPKVQINVPTTTAACQFCQIPRNQDATSVSVQSGKQYFEVCMASSWSIWHQDAPPKGKKNRLSPQTCINIINDVDADAKTLIQSFSSW